MPNPEPGAPRLAAVEGVGFVLVALLALGFQLWLPRVLPRQADDRAVAELLAREVQPGDVVLLHPWWTERARLFLPAGLPVVGYLGDEGDALLEHPRIWVLAEPSLPRTQDAAFAAAFLPGRTPLGPERRLGPYALTLYRNGRAGPLRFSALDALPDASVAVDLPGAGRTPCTREGARFRCPGGARVEPGWHEVLYQPHRCVLVVPPGGPAAVELAFDAVPPATALRFEVGIVWEHAWKHGSNITPVRATLSDAEGATPLASLLIPRGREGMVTVQVPGGARRLRVRIQSERADEREVCLVLRALDHAEGGR